jgi:hypothetical protein
MREREIAIAEFWKRIASVTGVIKTARNPSDNPSASDFPAIQFFELDDTITGKGRRGGYPIYTRTLIVTAEAFIPGTSESAATKELGDFVQEMKKKIYAGGNNLNKTCSEITEIGCTRVLRPPVGKNSIGIGVIFEIKYIENISTIM